MGNPKDLNKKGYNSLEMKKGTQFVILLLSSAIVLGSAYFLKLNLLYIFFGVLFAFIIIYFQKEIMKIILI